MSKKGKMFVLQDVMSVYRINKTSLWSDFWLDYEKCMLNNGRYLANFYYNVYNKCINLLAEEWGEF